jgi:hypothetical protein
MAALLAFGAFLVKNFDTGTAYVELPTLGLLDVKMKIETLRFSKIPRPI